MIRVVNSLVLIVAIALMGSLSGSASAQGTPTTVSDLAIPENLTPPEDAILLFALDARGDQVYGCAADPDDATSFVWTLVMPDADLLNARGEVVGHHGAGPVWEGTDGSAVTAALLERADAPESGAIPWLLLEATEHTGSGAFSTITHIQRLGTVGGVAPAEGCDEAHAGAEARAPYEAIYVFYYPAAPAMDAGMDAGAATIRVFTCPAELGQGEPDQEALLAGCAPLADAWAAPTLGLFSGGAPEAGVAGTATAPGVYDWEGLAFGDYLIGGEMPAEMGSMLVTDSSGMALQNPVLQLGEMAPQVEYRIFYFAAAATPTA